MSSDGDDQRIFWGFKFSILGFLGGGKIWQVFFWGGLIYVGIIWRIFRVILEICEALKFCMGFFVG